MGSKNNAYICTMKSKYKIEYYRNKTINDWTIIDFSHTDVKSQQYWLCKCKCGFEKSVRSSHIIREISKGCRKCRGQSLALSNSPYWKGGKFISSSLFNTYRVCAKNRKIDFNITIEDLEIKWNEQKGICSYTGIELSLPKDTRDKNYSASIDRIDSSKGYTKDNIHWVTKEINIMKMGLKEDIFLKMCELVYKHKL